MQDETTFPGGRDALEAAYDSRRDPFNFKGETFPPVDPDLTALANAVLRDEDVKWSRFARRGAGYWARKRKLVAREFIGKSQLSYLNALLIACLRRKDPPEGVDTLFLRLWAEQSPHLLGALDLRWKVSSVMTFADHGATAVQREAGQGFRMLFGLMKLFEAERLFSGQRPAETWQLETRVKAPLPLEMEDYALVNGGLQSAILAPLWRLAMTDPVIAPLADDLMTALNRDDGTVFRRLAKMREMRIAHRDAKRDE